MFRLPRARLAGLVLWTLVLCFVSQIPYALVWRGISTFPYDAFTTFNPWLVGQLAELRAGHGVFALYQDEVPFDIWPSYAFTGVLRQVFALFQPNSAVGHAVVQAVHVVLMVPAIALLYRSFGVPWRYGTVGGLVFTLVGIHVSLAHHVLAHEALLYLALALICIRALLRGWADSTGLRRAALFASTGIVVCSLVRVHHEAILYLIPLAAWALGHLVALRQRSGIGVAFRAAFCIGALGVLVGLASVPMLVSTYELSLINKTSIESYEQLGPYFSDPRAFFASLVLPSFSGGNSPTLPGTFSFRQEATLSYVFLGTLSLPLLVVVVATWWRDGRKAGACVLAATAVVTAGYALGVGSPIHRALSTVFPFLVNIGHNYYGLHLLYLVAAFSTAEGLHLVIPRRRFQLLAAATALQLVLAAMWFRAAGERAGWGPEGSLRDFLEAVGGDLRWHVVVAAVVVAAAIATGIHRGQRSKLAEADAGCHAGHNEWILLVPLVALVAMDLLRPVYGAHFLPNAKWVEWGTSPLGGFNPSRDIRSYLQGRQRGQRQPLRILPIFPRGGGWQGNALMATDMHLVGMPGDSGGNRYVEAWLAKGPDAERLMEFVRRFGVDAVWVSRWGVDEWAAAVRDTPLVKVYSSPYGGDVYMRRPSEVERPGVAGVTVQLPWHPPAVKQPAVEQGWVTRTWRFNLPPLPPASPAPRLVDLPLMWHAAYGIELDGVAARPRRSPDGTLVIELPGNAVAHRSVIVRYPSLPIAVLVWLAVGIYTALLAILSWSTLLLLRRRASRGTTKPDSSAPEPARRLVL